MLVVGSRNSSNSVRLTEIAQNVGTRAYLLDDVSELNVQWFPTGKETVLVTAGASAPEDLVAALCRELVRRYGATIETRDVFDEDVEFALPAAMRRLIRESGRPVPSGGIRVGRPEVSRELYGAVPVTISARTRVG
ncbi:hypothetical protein J4558_05160 [Leptolyngbya sp. 15MV]|nr:hypothetical protein J4558_05160 [Leptolyngbya sp. 15MV]